MRNWITPLFALALGFLSVGATSANVETAPELHIISPVDKTTIALADNADKTLDIAFAAIGFEVRPHGKCEGIPNCGHVHVQIDPENSSCNYPGKPGNNTNAATGGHHINALFALCPSPTGPHTLTISLANDNHSPVLVNGKPVTSSVYVITK